MSSRSKNTQLLTAGLIAIATIGLLVYFSNQNETAKAKTTKKKDEEDVTPAPKSSTTAKKEEKKAAAPIDDSKTPKKSNVTDQKELHSKIEELDKKGKALFKSKKVRGVDLFLFSWCLLSFCGVSKRIFGIY